MQITFLQRNTLCTSNFQSPHEGEVSGRPAQGPGIVLWGRTQEAAPQPPQTAGRPKHPVHRSRPEHAHIITGDPGIAN